MDVSTDSDTSEDVLVRSPTQDIQVKNVPAIVTWQASDGQVQLLEHLDFVLVYKHDSKQALIRLQTALKLRRESAKPNIFILAKPTEVEKLDCIRNDSDETLTEAETEQYRVAREKLGSSAYTLRFSLRTPAVFVVPKRQSYASFRAGSQATWRSWESFVKDTVQFMIHFPTSSLAKTRLLSFCQAASESGLTSLNDEVASLYGGEGGRIVGIHDHHANDGLGARGCGDVGGPDPSGPANDAPPAYDEHAAAGSSISATAPPLCLSPHLPPDRKRRRGASNSDSDRGNTKTRGKSVDASDLILHSIANLQRIVESSRTEHGAILTQMLAKMESLDGRVSRLEDQQQNLSKEMEACVEPLWDELSARLQSQEDREHDYMRDMADEVFGEKIDERMDEKIPEALTSYFRTGDDGQALVSEVVGDRIQEETRDFLRRQCFTTQMTIAENE
ncbi:hypothetical protein TruAng_002636 [Truncatella angustata]|nr:hypothetical protein TruAng_002636 [Truncatella angustata]